MPELLNKIDFYIFDIINKQLSNTLFDIFFPFITEKTSWIIPAVLLTAWLIIKEGNKGKMFLFLTIIVIFIADQLTSAVLKDVFARPRPYLTLDNVRLLVSSGNFSFPSSHAANAAGVAFLAGKYYPKYIIYYCLITFLIGYSRIYVGVHYPSDVLCGFLIGILCAIFVIKISDIIIKKYRLEL